MITIIIAIIFIIADQLTKLWVLNNLMPVRDIPIIDGVLHLHYAENTGAAFSMLEGMQWLFSSIAIIASIAIIIFVLTRKNKLHILATISAGLIVSGAIGNLIDRIRFGYVIDFVYVKIINFAIFNVADSCVVVGSILLSIYILFIHDKLQEKENNIKSDAKDKENE